jgi:hypothetical protein
MSQAQSMVHHQCRTSLQRSRKTQKISLQCKRCGRKRWSASHRELVTLFEAEAKLGTDFMSRLSERGENYSRGGIGLSGVDVRSG